MRYSGLSAVLCALTTVVSCLGINCRGSGLCPLATFENAGTVNIMQGLRDGVYSTTFPDSTVYNSGDHIICVSSSLKISIGAGIDQELKGGQGVSLGLEVSANLGTGGICLFPQDLKEPLTLGKIKKLADALLKHGCDTCGSVPVHFVDQNSNDPDKGILTFNYVAKPICVDNCISAANQPHASRQISRVRRYTLDQ